MSKQKKSKFDPTVFDGFGGVGSEGNGGGRIYARRSVNFRILKDGSLSKRQGFKFVTDFGDTPRAVYAVTVKGESVLYLLLGRTAYAYAVSDGSLSALGEVSTDSGSACFFHLRENLYLTDGAEIYLCGDGGLSPVSGYAPLIGKSWPCDVVGETYEPRNILNRHARATYVVSDPPSPFLCVGDTPASVEAVYINGALQKPERYSIDEGFCAVAVQGLEAGDRVEIYFTYKNGYDALLQRLVSSTCSALFGGIGSSRIFLCGGGGFGTVFGSKNVSESDISASQKIYPESCGLYFPIGYEFNAGNGVNGAQAILRHGDRILIFTEGDVWMVTPDGDRSYESGAVLFPSALFLRTTTLFP